MTSDPALLGLTEQRRVGLWRWGKQGSTLRRRAGKCSQQDLKGQDEPGWIWGWEDREQGEKKDKNSKLLREEQELNPMGQGGAM